MNVAISPTPGTSVRYPPELIVDPASTPQARPAKRSMSATFASIGNRMRLSLFSRDSGGEFAPSRTTPPATDAFRPPTGKTFPADEVVWGIVIRNGFDELDDPWYHRGTTQHAYLEGNDNVAICGFRPPQSGPRTRRRSRLGLPSAGEHPMCGICARMVVAPRPRVPVPVQGSRPPVPVRVARPAPRPLQPVPVARPVPVAGPNPVPPMAPMPLAPNVAAPNVATPTSPWVRQRAGVEQQPSGPTTVEFGTRHETGLMKRGVHSEPDQD